MNNPKPFFITLAIFLLSSGLLIFSVSKSISQSGNKNFINFNQIIETLSSISKQANSKTSIEINTDKNSDLDYDIDTDEISLDKTATTSSLIAPTPTPIRKSLLVPTVTAHPVPTAYPAVKPCRRQTVPHLDGSSSNLCYSNVDYNALSLLINQYNSAKFNLDSAQSSLEFWQEADKDAKSDIYKPKISEAQAEAAQFQNQLGEISLKMYAIESRGW